MDQFRQFLLLKKKIKISAPSSLCLEFLNNSPFVLVKLLQLITYMLLWDRHPFRAGVLLVETHVMDFGKGSNARMEAY